MPNLGMGWVMTSNSPDVEGGPERASRRLVVAGVVAACLLGVIGLWVLAGQSQPPADKDRCMAVLERCLASCSEQPATPPADAADLARRVDAFAASGAVECTKQCAARSGC